MTTEIIITSTYNGDKKQSTISSVNPDATNAQLSELGQRINALSGNSYVSTTRVDKKDVLEPEPTPPTPSTKTEGIITYDDNTHVVNYNGDGTLYMQSGNTEAETITSGSVHDYGEFDTYFFATATENYTAAVYVL